MRSIQFFDIYASDRKRSDGEAERGGGVYISWKTSIAEYFFGRKITCRIKLLQYTTDALLFLEVFSLGEMENYRRKKQFSRGFGMCGRDGGGRGGGVEDL